MRKNLLYFHRYRIKSETQTDRGQKKVALIELNNLLRGENTSYSYIVGDLSKLSKIKYVITL